MNKLYLCLLAFALFSFSCSKENTEIPKAIKDLMSQTSHCECDPFIDQYRWKGEIIYLSSCRGPACSCVTLYYDNMGKEFTMAEGYTPEQFRADSRFLKNVWSCKNH